MRIGSVWALVNGAIFLHEAVTLQKLLGIFLIILGGILAVWQKTRFKFTPGILMIIGGSFLFSLGSLVDKQIVTGTISPGLYRPITWALSSFWVLSYLRFDFGRIKKEYSLHGPKIFLVSFFISLYSYLALVSYRYGEISKAAPVISLSTIFTVIGAIIFLDENGNKWRKLLGAAIAIAGALILR
jgi:drug/metabolite transporter (DMT)-like permease